MRRRRMFTSTVFSSPKESRPQTVSRISSRDRALPGFSIKSFMMEYSTWVSFTRWPFFSSVRFRVLSRKGGWLISPLSTPTSPPVRR